MLQEILVVITASLGLLYGIEYLLRLSDDPREPPYVRPVIPIPLFGHVIGPLFYGFDYFNVLSKRTDAEIYSVAIFRFKIYITNDLRLRQLIRKAKTLSLRPFVRFGNRIHATISDDAYHRFSGDLLENFRTKTKETLSPGPHLDPPTRRMGDEALRIVNELLQAGTGDFSLLDWSRHIVIQATAASLFGFGHPYKDPTIEDAAWTWNEYRPSHMIGRLGDPFGKGYKARAKVFESFRQYFDAIPEDVSPLIRERQKILLDGGFDREDIYKMHSNLSDAYLSTVPTLVWTVYDIFSRPTLLEAIREELLTEAVHRSSTHDGTGIRSNVDFVLHVSSMKTRCHLLLSTLQEIQRTRHRQAVARAVVEDTILDGKYILKKGNYVQMPAKPLHQSAEVWTRPEEFNASRFIQEVEGQKKMKTAPGSFQPWGASPDMCPARAFAATEILVIVALLCLRVDLTPANGRPWERHLALKSVEIATLPRPKRDVFLRFTIRPQSMGTWEIEMGESNTKLVLASG